MSTTPTATTSAPQKSRRRKRGPRRRRVLKPSLAGLSHHVFTKGQWRRAKISKHPRVSLTISPEHLPSPAVKTDAVADSGAQIDVWGMDEYLRGGFRLDDLQPVSMSLDAANKSPICIDGAFFATITGLQADGTPIECKSMTYVSRDVHSFYLSEETMMALGMLSPDFPSPGCALNSKASTTSILSPSAVFDNVPSTQTASLRAINEGCTSQRTPEDKVCDCPIRRAVPPRPTELPFPCTPENNGKMKQWLLDRYADSTFNTCPHRPIPCMAGPPLEIHLKEDAVPYARHKARPIPVHWEKQVYEDLLRDEAIGVIERVPYGEGITWCHPMQITRKHDGSPRRVVDLSHLNKHCNRETHHSESPFHVARRVPSNTWRTVTDAWNGFHFMPLRESDRHLTTFTTPFGLWRYKRAVQGYLSSGDGFNRRFDAILRDFERKERIVDDTIHYDTDLDSHWWRTIDFLTTTGSSGIVLNPEKFQFAEREVDFAGFRIAEERIDPLPKFFSAIQDFPTPTSTTDIKSWFGLVNQIAHYAQLRDIMAPFRPFLSEKRQPFYWDGELDDAFTRSKDAIISAIRRGVEIYDPLRRTCLRTDWSKRGLGYFLLQKHCHCKSDLPNCCSDGWRITLAGSRFLQSAEERYAPIEGEGLAVAWSLEQTRFFTLGCDDLVVVTDHKPLVKLLGDRTLDEIQNNRLFRIKQRTLPWYYKIYHLPGKTNFAADALSRHPSSCASLCWKLEAGDHIEHALLAMIKRDASNRFSISWEAISRETNNDDCMRSLLEYISKGFPEHLPEHLSSLKPYWRYRHSFSELDGVILYNDRVVIPPSLREKVIEILHSAHQGVTSMEARARATVFWPGLTLDMDHVRASCPTCIKNAPSQPRLLPASSDIPSTPFEKIVGDFFEFEGHHYLVVADRLSGWSEVFKSKPGTPQSGADGLISCLRNCFSCYGVPTELASDGGPEFVSHKTEEFLVNWGVEHRLSSAYHPQSNGRAEVAVKTVKRLLKSNTGPNGSLNNDNFLRALLQLRNTPDPDCNLSPAQVMFGRPLRDAFSFTNRLEKFSNPHIRPTWRDAWKDKEAALRQRFHRSSESLKEHARPLPPLVVGDRCYIQNQTGNSPRRWDRSGIVVETLGHDSYHVKVDGSNRLTRRNRRYLRKFTTPSMDISFPAPPRASISNPITHNGTAAPSPITTIVQQTDIERPTPNFNREYS